ncbi:sugar phosphate isomerase/epimerase family protein [Streptomyces sp. NPDC051985]|uniref:sugar phosphate isomerase/epimerase family protein n=1 Tax=Streptomyces sp. NPDC051985 TaxID=3155807 RepID=UPI00342450A3
MPITASELVCSHFTISGAQPRLPSRFGFAEQVAAVAEAGFTGIGLMGSDYVDARARGMTDADFSAILDDHGIVLAETEFLMDWSAGDDEPERVARARALEEGVWRVADAFGPRVVSVGELVPGLPPVRVLAERFGALCDRAAAHGLLVALEFMPWSGIPDVVRASEVVRLAGRPNAGLNIDMWHYFRGTPNDAALRDVADRVFMVQLADADAEIVGDIREDSLQRRRCPGDGDLDLEPVVRLLHDAGAPAPVSVEVISLEQHALPAGEAARRAYAGARGVLEGALSAEG